MNGDRRFIINNRATNGEKKVAGLVLQRFVNTCQSQTTISPTNTKADLKGKKEVYYSYLVNIVHPTQHVKVGVKFVQHPHDVHGNNFVVGT